MMGSYSETSVEFNIFIAEVTISKPVLQIIQYTVQDPEKFVAITSLSQSLNPPDSPIDLAAETINYELKFEGLGAVPNDYFIKLD